ncbi:MAG: hypothetical protein AAFY65_16970 [Pseudomonadota bacterium]
MGTRLSLVTSPYTYAASGAVGRRLGISPTAGRIRSLPLGA